jgi:hypothetical protein
MRAAALECVAERSRLVLLLIPSAGGERLAGALGRKIRDADQVHAARAPHLGEEHGAELAGSDQSDRDGAAGRLALEQQRMEIHCVFPWVRLSRRMTSQFTQP